MSKYDSTGATNAQASPVESYSPTPYLERRLPAGAELELPVSYPEVAAYVVAGVVQIEDHSYMSGVMAVACSGKPVSLFASTDSHVMVIGGEPVGDRHIRWNFVSSSKDRIEQAKADWRQGRFDGVPGESEFIPYRNSGDSALNS